MLIILCITAICAATIMFFSRRLLRYLWLLQRDEYSRRQFGKGLMENNVYDRKGSLIATMAALAIELTREQIVVSSIISILAAIALVYLGFWEGDPRLSESVKLDENARSQKIYHLSLSFYSIGLIIAIVTTYALVTDDDIACYWLIAIIAIQSSPIWLMLASSL
jgi:UDP-N-acetylmuramoyl-tripeptide--D-alanyl-D-alanine ligase